MEIELLLIGRTDKSYILNGEDEFSTRIKRYHRFTRTILDIPKKLKSLPPDLLKKEEAKTILKHLKTQDYLILLDENGHKYSSRSFAQWLQKQLIHSHHRIVFLIGGPFGFDKMIYERANHKLSLSTLTFSHQLIRFIFLEQLYRAFTIIRNEKYHND